MKQIYLLAFLAITLNLSAQSTTLTFTNHDTSWSSDGIAEDGEGGSTDISNLNIIIYNVDQTLANINSIEWKSSTDLASNVFHGLSTFTSSNFEAWKGQIIKESLGAEFKLISFDWFDWGNYDSQPMQILGFRDGAQVASSNFTGNSTPDSVTVNLNSDFNNVDEVRIITQSATTYPTINNIEIADSETLKVTGITTTKKSIKIIPNPTTNFIKISGLKTYENYQIYNVLGVKVKNGIIWDDKQIDIRNLINGLYFLKLDNRNVIKFIKK